MPSQLVLADGLVGKIIVDWLLKQYPADLALVVAVEKNAITEACDRAGVAAVVGDDDATILNNVHDRRLEIDLGFTLWWPKLVRPPLLSIPHLGFVNTHPSLLPHCRGKNYNFWTIVEEVPFGVSLHLLDNGIDTGPILAQKRLAYDWEDTGETLFNLAQSQMAELFKKTYPTIRQGNLSVRPQDAEAGSFHKAKEMDAACLIHLERLYSARELINLLRARTFTGHPGCRFVDGERTYEVKVSIKEVDP